MCKGADSIIIPRLK